MGNKSHLLSFVLLIFKYIKNKIFLYLKIKHLGDFHLHQIYILTLYLSLFLGGVFFFHTRMHTHTHSHTRKDSQTSSQPR